MDEMTQLLLSHLAAGSDPSAGPPLADVLEQSLGDDPMAAPLAAALRQREAAAEADEEAELGEDVDPEVADVFERIYAELEGLRERNRMLADALGACPRCFGEDEACPVCHGQGRPGGRRPDPSLFIELVEPAMRRVGDLPAEPEMQVERQP